MGSINPRRPLKKPIPTNLGFDLVYTMGQYIERSRNASKFTVYPSPAYNGIER